MRMDKYTSLTAYGWGAFTAMLGALSLNDWAIVIGILSTIGTNYLKGIIVLFNFLISLISGREPE
ncbi:HP1 family phage holin [Xenorhabdus beddingii]|uniref:HP1 family phage holin n=1 Tax=Xenorhabdus beddingii TaxID=40578 RepID=UPI000A321FD4|nr:HP1 family phage holin [Xenorhabdus beddingii]